MFWRDGNSRILIFWMSFFLQLCKLALCYSARWCNVGNKKRNNLLSWWKAADSDRQRRVTRSVAHGQNTKSTAVLYLVYSTNWLNTTYTCLKWIICAFPWHVNVNFSSLHALRRGVINQGCITALNWVGRGLLVLKVMPGFYRVGLAILSRKCKF